MSMRNLILTLDKDDGTNGWQQLSALIAAEQAANDADNLPTVCHNLVLINPETNADGTVLQITSDPVDFTVGYRKLKEEEQPFDAPCYNNLSTMDKWIRLVDGAEPPVAVDGDVRVVINFA